nr:MAG TPA: hypothetical protein [Caudoviricetes sp.]
MFCIINDCTLIMKTDYMTDNEIKYALIYLKFK